ncbi:hypothetical protein EYR41_012118 [Orbilia oligospora]|uniref:Uncharacterized protein n=1 Tax=Orbilia oligospora TaxID=2813651 RepID=A0A8H2DWQ1_ORBOL|nr:hypothetical protein EYR41_012118 [Orbilia oligospora]
MHTLTSQFIWSSKKYIFFSLRNFIPKLICPVFYFVIVDFGPRTFSKISSTGDGPAAIPQRLHVKSSSSDIRILAQQITPCRMDQSREQVHQEHDFLLVLEKEKKDVWEVI